MYVINLVCLQDGKEVVFEKCYFEVVEQIVTVLGMMKGVVMKLGQVMSFFDVGFVFEEHCEEFQCKFGAFCDVVLKVRFDDMRKVIEFEFEVLLIEIFSYFDIEFVVVVLIGQVYCVILYDGCDVVVKVQYFGVGVVVCVDMQNFGIILWLFKCIVFGFDVKVMVEEICSWIVEEFDYEFEVINQCVFACIFCGYLFIVIFDVVMSLLCECVLIFDYVYGDGFDMFKHVDQVMRDCVVEIVFCFYFGCMYCYWQFFGDLYLGNFLMLHNGWMVFFDFGLFKVMLQYLIDIEFEIQCVGYEGDAQWLWEIWVEGGLLCKFECFCFDKLFLQFFDVIWWYLIDEEIQFGFEIVIQVMIDMLDSCLEHFGQMCYEILFVDYIFGWWVEMFMLVVFGQLCAKVNWYWIVCEWIYGDLFVIELGC